MDLLVISLNEEGDLGTLVHLPPELATSLSGTQKTSETQAELFFLYK